MYYILFHFLQTLSIGDFSPTAKEEAMKKIPKFFDHDYLGSSAMSNGCTGMIPIAAQNEDALNSYEEIYPYLPILVEDMPPGEQMPQLLNIMTPEKHF